MSLVYCVCLCVGMRGDLFVHLITGNKTRAESVVSEVNTYQQRLSAPKHETHWGEVVIVFLEGKWHRVIILNPPTESFFHPGGNEGQATTRKCFQLWLIPVLRAGETAVGTAVGRSLIWSFNGKLINEDTPHKWYLFALMVMIFLCACFSPFTYFQNNNYKNSTRARSHKLLSEINLRRKLILCSTVLTMT